MSMFTPTSYIICTHYIFNCFLVTCTFSIETFFQCGQDSFWYQIDSIVADFIHFSYVEPTF